MLSTKQSEVWAKLNAKLRGHYQYYWVNDNWPELMVYFRQARWLAKRWLSRRSQNTYVNWDDFSTYCKRHPLAQPGKVTDLIAMVESN